MPGRISKTRKSQKSPKKTTARESATSTRKPRTRRYSSLSPREKATHKRCVNFLSDLRAGKDTYSNLLRKHHLTSYTVHKYLGGNLLGGGRGKRVRASKSDRLVRELLFPMPFGDIPIRTRNSRNATKLSEFFNDRDKLLRRKLSADEFEAKWRGVRVAGRELFTDPEVIFRNADFGELRVEDLYASVGGER